MKHNAFREKLDRVLGAPVKHTSARIRRALGFEKVAVELFMFSQEAREQIQRKVERILGGGAGKVPPRIKRALGFEDLEQRLVMSATLGATDGTFEWVDGDGKTQALEVTHGSVEVHFTDDVGNTGDITEIKLLSNHAGFDVSTSNINLINSGGKHIGDLNVGVNVDGVSADTDGTVDSISATKHISGSIHVDGNVGDISVGNHIQNEITISGDLDSVTVKRPRFSSIRYESRGWVTGDASLGCCSGGSAATGTEAAQRRAYSSGV